MLLLIERMSCISGCKFTLELKPAAATASCLLLLLCTYTVWCMCECTVTEGCCCFSCVVALCVYAGWRTSTALCQAPSRDG